MERSTVAAVAVLTLAIGAGVVLYLAEDLPEGDPAQDPHYRGVPHVSGHGNTSLPLLPTALDAEGRLVGDLPAEPGDSERPAGAFPSYCNAAAPPEDPTDPLRFHHVDRDTDREGNGSSLSEDRHGEPVRPANLSEGEWAYATWGEPASRERPLAFVVADRGIDHEHATDGIVTFAAYSPHLCVLVMLHGTGGTDDHLMETQAPRGLNLSALAFDPVHFGFWYVDGLTTDRVVDLAGPASPEAS